MGILDRLRGDQGGAVALTASAQQVDLDADPKSRSRGEQWQRRAWGYYDEIPEIWFAHNFVANSLRRVRIYPAIQPDPLQPPQPLEPGDPNGTRAYLELDRLRSTDGSHGELLHDLAMQLCVPGEGYLLLEVDEQGFEDWGVFSTDEVRYDKANRQWRLYDGPDDREGRPLSPDAFIARLWRQHPRWRNYADSGMRAVLDECEELLILQRYYRSTARSRLNAGVLLWPAEAKGAAIDPRQRGQGQEANTNPVLDAIMTMMTTPIQDEGSASAVVPGLITMKADLIEKVRQLSFAREFDQVAAERMDKLLGRIAAGIDLPSEVVLGMQDLNHWTAWQVDQDTFDSHLAPLCELMVNGITEAFLRPAMADVPNPPMVWYDASSLIAHPNRSTDADNAFDRMAISTESYRRYKGYNEEDAPEDAEIEQRIEWERARRAAPPGGTSGAPPDPGAADPGPPADAVTASVATPATSAVVGLGRQLAEIDHDLRLRLQAAAQSVVFRALERAGARMRRRVQGDATLRALVAGVPNHQVCAVLGRDRFAEDPEDESSVAPIIPLYVEWVTRAQQRTLELAQSYGADVSGLDTVQQTDRDAGQAALVGALTGLVAARLFDRSPLIEPGEFDPSVTVPPGLIRNSLRVAGGGTSAPATGLIDGEVATGRLSMEALASAGLVPVAHVWNYGDPSTRGTAFPGHYKLNGVEFTGWDDPVLTVAPSDSWLKTSYYYPGDHAWCQCDTAPVFTEE